MNKYSTNSKPIYAGGHLVGFVKDDAFCKTIKGSKHILHKPKAIALSVESLRQVEQAGANEIQITDIESGVVYSCTIEHFKSYSFSLQRGGFEPQLALALERFGVSSPLEISSHAPKRGEVKRKPGNGQRVRNPRDVQQISPRQLVFKGLL